MKEPRPDRPGTKAPRRSGSAGTPVRVMVVTVMTVVVVMVGTVMTVMVVMVRAVMPAMTNVGTLMAAMTATLVTATLRTGICAG